MVGVCETRLEFHIMKESVDVKGRGLRRINKDSGLLGRLRSMHEVEEEDVL